MKVTEEVLLDLIAEEAIVDRAKLTRDAKLAELGVSSVDLISMMFEIEGVTEDIARQALRLAADKLSVKSIFETRTIM